MPSPGTRTIGRGQSLSRLARHGRGVVVHGGKLIVPAVSDAEQFSGSSLRRRMTVEESDAAQSGLN